MKYALLAYDIDGSWDELSPEQKRALHGRASHQEPTAGSVDALAHYRMRPPRHTRTLRLVEGKLASTEGPATETTGTLRALYLLDGDDETVLRVASELPAIHLGGCVEIWPLIEPAAPQREHHHHEEPESEPR